MLSREIAQVRDIKLEPFVGQYRKKSTELADSSIRVDAFQLTTDHSNQFKWPEWLRVAWRAPLGQPGTFGRNWPSSEYYVETLGGFIPLSLGDWLLRGVQGEIYPCKSELFEQAFELVE